MKKCGGRDGGVWEGVRCVGGVVVWGRGGVCGGRGGDVWEGQRSEVRSSPGHRHALKGKCVCMCVACTRPCVSPSLLHMSVYRNKVMSAILLSFVS